MKNYRILPIIVVLLCLGLACNFPGYDGERTPTPADPDLAATIQAIGLELTATALAGNAPSTAEPVPSATEAPTQTLEAAPTKTVIPSITATAKPCNAAGFIDDVTIPDDKKISPGAGFTKTWRLVNVGTCTWTSSYRLVFSHGDRMGAPDTVQLTNSAIAPGMTVDVSVDLVAPDESGTYQGYYLLRDGEGTNFGINTSAKEPFWVKIRVPEPTAEPEPIAEIEITEFKICSSPKADVPCQISVSVYNSGNKKTGPYVIQFFQSDSAPAGCTWNMNNNAHGGQTVTCLHTFPSAYSNIRARVVADVGNAVPEEDEDNNTVYKTINVAP
mgnify:FL=1